MTFKPFWKAIALFAYRRWATADEAKPTGIPGNRDPKFICTAFSPRQWEPGDFRDCEGDGHYLCKECCHLKSECLRPLECGCAECVERFGPIHPGNIGKDLRRYSEIRRARQA